MIGFGVSICAVLPKFVFYPNCLDFRPLLVLFGFDLIKIWIFTIALKSHQEIHSYYSIDTGKITSVMG